VAATRAVETVAATTPRTILAVGLLVLAVLAVAVLAFRLSIGGAIALYFIVWWTIVFAVLPRAARRGIVGQGDASGADPGAPAEPRLREQVIWTTLWSDLVFLLAVAAFPLAGL
jgi:predicted secreted protein